MSSENTSRQQPGTPREEIEEIKRENLTGRQLRIARRLAHKHGLEPTSDLDAVRLLRKRGIDPFQSTNLLHIAANSAAGAEQPTGAGAGSAGAPSGADTSEAAATNALVRQARGQQLPAQKTNQNQLGRIEPTKQAAADAPDRAAQSETERSLAVAKIRRDLVRRRRRRSLQLFVKLMVFIFLPTFIAGYYFYKVATPMYATHSEFIIQKADNPAAASPSAGGGLLGAGSPLANAQDSMTVQSYLTSREAMLRLDEEHDFRKAFTDESLDVLQRLPEGASNEATYKLYQKHVIIGYDPTEGIIRMEVIAPTPEQSQLFSNALVGYAEEQVDQLTQRLREDQMRGSRESYEDSELRFSEAQERVLELQEQRGILSADMEVNALMTQITTYETDMQDRRLELQELLDNPRPNSTKVEVLRNSIERREELVAQLRAQLTEGNERSASLAKISGELLAAQAQLEVRQAMLAASLEQLKVAQVEASRQTRYLSLGVSPVAPDEATYPKSFINTLLAGLFFLGIFMILSLTMSVLKEQVSG